MINLVLMLVFVLVLGIAVPAGVAKYSPRWERQGTRLRSD